MGLILYIIIAFAVSFLFSFVTTPVIIQLCKKHKLYDLPNDRKVHNIAIPRLGGTLFMPSMGIGVAIALSIMYGGFQKNFEITISTFLMIAGAFMIFLIGIIDDLKGIDASHKFVIQFIAALFFPLCNLMINNLHGFFGIYEISLWLSYPITVLSILLIVNAINLIDGIDGLSSSLAFLILITFAYLFLQLDSTIFSLMSSSLAGAILAFLIFNVFGKVGKNKIFMGDAGSLFLGYVLAYLAIKYQMYNETGVYNYREESLLISTTLLFIPCIDVIRVAIFRKISGKKMFDADKTHIHHLLMQSGLSMRQTLITIIAFFIFICGVNYICNPLMSKTLILVLDILLYSLFIFTIQKSPCTSKHHK